MIGAAPVAARGAVKLVRGEVDEVVCPYVVDGLGAVGLSYVDYPDVGDEQVAELLGAGRETRRNLVAGWRARRWGSRRQSSQMSAICARAIETRSAVLMRTECSCVPASKTTHSDSRRPSSMSTRSCPGPPTGGTAPSSN